jgi:phosphatidylglycerophosphate synthase
MKKIHSKNLLIQKFTIADSISLFRLLVSPLAVLIAGFNYAGTYAWLMILLFLSDVADGLIARLRNETSRKGARLDSIADVLMITAVLFGLIKFHADVLFENFVAVSIVVFFYLLTMLISLFRYGKISSFHTYLSKLSAVFLAILFAQLFFFSFSEVTFLIFLIIYLISSVEELVLMMLIPTYRTDVKGLFWLLNSVKEQARIKALYFKTCNRFRN